MAETEIGIDGILFAGSELDFEAPNIRMGFISGAVSVEPSVALSGCLDSDLWADVNVGKPGSAAVGRPHRGRIQTLLLRR